MSVAAARIGPIRVDIEREENGRRQFPISLLCRELIGNYPVMDWACAITLAI
jgi:hypothetical protein